MATIKDIAARLGISVSAVSKGLNGANDISEELRQQVLDTAIEMGYTPKRIRKESRRKLCVLIKNMDYTNPDEFAYDIVLGFRQSAIKQKWDIQAYTVTEEMQQEEKYDSFLLRNGYLGALLVGFSFSDTWIKQLQTTTTPSVLFDNTIRNNPNVCYIGSDSFEGIQLAIDHLYALGHRNIAFLNGNKDTMVASQRQDAYKKSMESYELPTPDTLTAYGEYTTTTAKDYVEGFLNAGATAILCGNDLIASGVISECNRLGFRVPEDVSVIGFDDLPISMQTNPPLTTIRQERSELGRFAYDSLNGLIHHIRISRILLRPELIERKSTGPVRKDAK